MTDAEKIVLIKETIGKIFDNRTENTAVDRACRNIARSFQLIVEPDAKEPFEFEDEK